MIAFFEFIRHTAQLCMLSTFSNWAIEVELQWVTWCFNDSDEKKMISIDFFTLVCFCSFLIVAGFILNLENLENLGSRLFLQKVRENLE